jgi:hypothetical protein
MMWYNAVLIHHINGDDPTSPLDKLGATPGGKRWLHFF